MQTLIQKREEKQTYQQILKGPVNYIGLKIQKKMDFREATLFASMFLNFLQGQP